MTPYEILKQHIAKHKYTRGANKGDAPLDPKRRRRDWERVVQHPDKITVHRYRTDILTVYPDGRIVLDFDGWETSTTTRTCATEALWLIGIKTSVGSVRYKNLSQVCVNLPSGTYKYYDGMELVQKDGEWIPYRTEPFRAKVTDPEKLGAFNEAIKHSGFKQLFPLIYASAEIEDRSLCPHTQLAITSQAHAELWPGLIAYFKLHSNYSYRTRAWEWEARTVQQTWNKIVNPIKRGFVKTITTDTHVL